MNQYIVTNGDGAAGYYSEYHYPDLDSSALSVLNGTEVAEMHNHISGHAKPQIYLLVPLPHTAAVEWLEKLAVEGKDQDAILRECAIRNILEWPLVHVEVVV